MLRKIEIENFFSIKERQVLDLTIASNATDPDNRFAEPVPDSDVRIPRVVTFFGANASGKTTVLKAIVFLRDFIRPPSGGDNNIAGHLLPFWSLETEQSTSQFAVEFDWEVSPGQGRTVFRYELEINGNSRQIFREALYYWPAKRRRKLFERTEDGIFAGADFDLPKSDPVRGKVGPHAGVISMLSQFNHQWSVLLRDAMAALISNVSIVGKIAINSGVAANVYAHTDGLLDALNRDLKSLDLGIDSVGLIDTERGKMLSFVHTGLSQSIHYTFESQGTQSFCLIYPSLWRALETGGIAVLDEFDNDIHSLLLPEFIKKFQDPETNPNNAQLIISCHNPTLLDYLTKEEVVFTEKDDEGQTHMYRLADVQGVRRDSNYYAKYLMGVYGAVPRVA